jgi:putative salt-induced outer membrane protein YdiY
MTDTKNLLRPGARSGAVLVAIALGSLCAGARADSITLHNGDRLTGRILHMSPSTLTFETTWAGELKIPRYEVSAIETDKPVTILRERAERTESVMMKPAGPGKVLLTPEAARPAPQAGQEDAAPTAATAPAAATAATAPTAATAATAPAAATAAPAGQPLQIARLRYLNPKPEESGEGVSYNGRAALSGAFARGGTTSDRLYAEGDFGARALDWRYALTGKFLQESDDAGTTAQNWLVSGNFDRFLDDDSFLYARGSAERDRFRDISRRATLGVGYGRQLIQTERTALSVRAGPEVISVRRLAGEDDTSPALGWGLNFSHRLDTLSAEVFHDQRGFRTLGGDTQLSLRSRTGLRVPLASGLTASLQLNLDWDDDTGASRGGSDTTWLIGLGYAW